MKDFWAEELQNQRKGKLLKVAILIVILLIIIAFAVLIVVYFQNTDFRKWCDENRMPRNSQKIFFGFFWVTTSSSRNKIA